MRLYFFTLLFLLPLAAKAQDVPNQELPDRVNALEERLSALEGAPAKVSLSQYNPAMGIALDAVLRDRDSRVGFDFRSTELSLESSVDPFLKGWVVLNGDRDGVAVEEAAAQTTSLPYNLMVKGGRFFANFGRQARFHDHQLATMDRPNSLDIFIGGETRADGLEANYLLPTETFVNATFGVYNKMGAENTRANDAELRSPDEFTYLGRLNAYRDIGDDHGLELGVNSAWTPKRVVSAGGASVPSSEIARQNTWRTLHGLDLTLRYHPVQGGWYRGFIWGVEVLQNTERRFDPATLLPTDRVRAYSGYSFFEFKQGRRWRPGVMIDLTEDLDNPHQLTKTYAAYINLDPTQFQRLRLQYSRIVNNVPGQPASDRLGLQWTIILGYHVHGFKDR